MEQQLLIEHILNLEKRLMSYEYNEFEELLADDFLEFGSSGKSINKNVLLEAVKGNNTTNSIQLSVTDFRIKMLTSDVLLATYKTLRHNDRKYALRSSIWKKNEDEWQMIFHQGTPTQET